MIKQNINIIEFQILYNILYEVRENLIFELYNYKNESEFIQSLKKKDLKTGNSLVIIKSDNKLLTENSLIDKRTIYQFNSLPLKIDELIQKINIQLIKQKYNFQSQIHLKKYTLNLNSRKIINHDKNLKLTEKEIGIILFLNENKIPQNIQILQNEVWGYSSELETHTVETHIYRLRKKMKDTFNDDNFILSNDKGYLI
tara:strand:- start:185 stop:781 length:597 start_codon:yes stop_codon:yes gene_type:complete